jgi:ABC-type amino acid transport substrate-binding protein
VRKQCEELRQAVDRTLEAMWADGSLNKIKRVYLDPLEIEPAAHP